MPPDPAELMNPGESADDRIIFDYHMTGQRAVVRKNHMVADRAIVRDMRIREEVAVIPDARRGVRQSPSVHGAELAE